MKPYASMNTEERRAERAAVQARYDACKARGLSLNMARGKPGREQLDLVSDILTALTDPADCICGGIDARNYGELCGLPEARALYAEILGCRPTEIFAGGNASLALMFGLISKAWTFGLKDSLEIFNEMGLSVDRIIASGGGAKSSVWLQMQADIFEKEVIVCKVKEQACLGACIMAGIGEGVFADAEKAADKLV